MLRVDAFAGIAAPRLDRSGSLLVDGQITRPAACGEFLFKRREVRGGAEVLVVNSSPTCISRGPGWSSSRISTKVEWVENDISCTCEKLFRQI